MHLMTRIRALTGLAQALQLQSQCKQVVAERTTAELDLVVSTIQEVYQTVYPAAKSKGHSLSTTDAVAKLHALGERMRVLAETQEEEPVTPANYSSGSSSSSLKAGHQELTSSPRIKAVPQQLQNKEGPSNIAVYKETLANSFRRSVSFGDCADETPRQVSLGQKAAVEGLTALGFTAWDKACKVVQPHQGLLELKQQGLVVRNPDMPSPAVRGTQTCVVPFWKVDHLHIFVPEWGDVNVGNCEALMAILPDEHKGVGANKQDLSLVLLRAAFVVFVSSKLLPWMHYGDDLNMSSGLLTQSTLPPTASEACGMVRRVFHRSRDGTSLDAFLTEVGAANPHISSDEMNDEPAADAIVDGQKWQDLSMDQQDEHLSQHEGADKICDDFKAWEHQPMMQVDCSMQLHSTQGCSGQPDRLELAHVALFVSSLFSLTSPDVM